MLTVVASWDKLKVREGTAKHEHSRNMRNFCVCVCDLVLCGEVSVSFGGKEHTRLSGNSENRSNHACNSKWLDISRNIKPTSSPVTTVDDSTRGDHGKGVVFRQ